MEKNTAPIVLFVYNRPWHTKQVLQTLQHADMINESRLYVFSDGPKRTEDKIKVQKVRRLLEKMNGVQDLEIIKRESNYGLENSIQSGLNAVFEVHEKAIILEDDILVGKYFLRYMNNALTKYHQNEKVCHVAANSLNLENIIDEQTYFLHSATCWGWGTWKRAWQENLISLRAADLLQQLEKRNLVDTFNFNGASPYLKMLKNNAQNGNKSWAIKWYALLVLNNNLALHPYRPITRNIGWDGSGTNMGKASQKQSEYCINAEVRLEDIALSINPSAFEYYKNYYLQKK